MRPLPPTLMRSRHSFSECLPAFRGRFFIMTLGKRLRPRRGGGGGCFQREVFLGADHHIRRGGSGVDVGRGRLRRPRPSPVHAFPPPARATQASPPTPSTTPAPTGTKGPPRRSHKKPPPERLCWRMTQRMELGLMIAKTRPMLRQLDLHLRPISARFNQECHS